MKKINDLQSYLTRLRGLMLTLIILCSIGSGNAWGQVLFHETFGNNTGSARTWSDTYSVKSGVEAVYSGITGYTVSNCKQGKNSTGSTLSGLIQTTMNKDAYIIIGPLSVASYSSLGVTYQWNAASTKGTYTTKLYYATSSEGSYTEVTGSGTGSTKFVERSYSLPVAAQVSTLYLKIVWNTSNTQAIIDEVELTGTAAASCDKKVTIVKGTPETGGSFNLDKTGAQDCCSALTVTVSNITAPSGKEFDAITQSGIATGVTINQSAKTVTYAANSTGTSTINVTFRDLPKYTVTLMDDSGTRTQESAGASVELPSRNGCAGYTFAGWTKSWVAPQESWTTTAPIIIQAGNYTPAANENLYPVYTKEEGGGEPVETKTQVFQYDTWEYGGSSTNKTSYRLFHNGGYVESASDVDFSKLSKVIVYGGTFGGASYDDISIRKEDGTVWKDATVSGSDQTGVNTITGGTSLTGSAKLRVYSTCGMSSSNGVRISKVEVYTLEGGTTTYYISEANCCSLQAATSVRVTSVAATSVTLGWTAPSSTIGITKLQVVDGNGTVKVDNLAANATSATVTGLTECESYSFHIVSVGSSCNVSSASVPAQPYSGAKTVTYNYHEGTGSPASFTTDCSHTSTTLPTPTRANYRFDGWYTSASGGTRKGGGGDSYTPDATIELHAQWTRVYTVSYDYAGGSGSCVAGGPYAEGETVTTCAAATRSGYTFKGWSDGVTTYNAGSTISNVQNDIVLTAQWTADTYTITYNGVKPGAENNNPTSYTVEDLPINLVAATHDQWRFDGWTDDNAGNADITTIPAGTTGNQSFTAHWTKRYAVTWYEESTPTIEYYDPGTTLQFPADPSAPASCSEKKFVGWMVGTITGETDDKPTFVTAGEVNADAAYHAVWATQYEESGTKTLFSDQLLVTGTAAVSTPRDGWSSILYAYGYNGNGIRLSSGSYGASMTVDLSGKELGSTLTITFDAAKYSSENGSLSLSCLDDGANPTFTPASFTISNASWEEKSCTITNVDGKVASITLTGTKNQRFYMKNFKVTTSGMITKYKEYSTSCCDNNVAAPSVTATATRNSITLSWTNVTDATGYKVTINGDTHDVTTGNCTYTESGLTSGTDYAWTVIATYNPANYCGAIPTKNTTTTLSVYGVTYNKNTTIGSGTVTMSPMPSDVSTYVVGENVTAAAKPATCTNSGYTFNGWNTEPDGTGTHVDAEGTIPMVEGGLTLYAEWVAKRAYYIDRMHGQGDQTIEIGGKTYHCYYGDGYHTTPSPSDQKSGDACQAPHYRFVRWLTIGHINADGTQKDTGGAVGGGVQRGTVTDGETYYAIWEEEIDE